MSQVQITYLHIQNFKSIKNLEIKNIQNALIFVGKNNAGKTSLLQALNSVSDHYQINENDFDELGKNIEISISLHITKDDLSLLHENGIVSQYKKYDLWYKDFCKKLPSYLEEELTFTFVCNKEGTARFQDGFQKNNRYIPEVFPTTYVINSERKMEQLQNDLLLIQEDELFKLMRTNCCMFDRTKVCTHCFNCIGLIHQKTPEELNAFEASKLFEYKLYLINIDQFEKRVNDSFRRNGGYDTISFYMDYDINEMLKVKAEAYNKERDVAIPVEHLGKGMRSIYMLSLLEAYINEPSTIPCIVMVEEPELFLHPELQKIASEVLYRLSRKNQVIFSTHSPNLLFNFNQRQIRQIVLNRNCESQVQEKTDLGMILDDLGYTANDLLNVDFVFIVEGKQDKNRLPLLLNRYYTEMRIAIITTNSCTNIKTYANLKYMNQIYLKHQFLMIRDGDGKNPEELGLSLCKYYDQRNLEDIDQLPKVTRKNVLILKYYSFENYFLNPIVMTKLGIVDSEEAFYNRLWSAWNEYLHRIKSGKHLIEIMGKNFDSKEEMKAHMEDIKIYVRGHNLFDLFYGPYRKKEKYILEKYIEIAPKEDFQDIVEAIDKFVYFQSKH